MSRTTLFCFSHVPGGYYLNNGKTSNGKAIPVSMAAAMNQNRLRDLKSISISPEGGWIACYKENAKGGPDGDNYLGDGIPPSLAEYLTRHAHENRSNPVQWIKMGPADQYYVRRRTTMEWRMTAPLRASMRKLQALGIHAHLEEVVFGPDDTAIFIFDNGAFLWDLPLDSEEHKLLQECFAMGTHLEAAALSFVAPHNFFFFWGHANANFKLPQTEHAQIGAMIKNCDVTRMQMSLLGGLLLGSAMMNGQTRMQNLRQSMADYQAEQRRQNGDIDFNIAGLVAWQGTRNAARVAQIVAQFQDKTKPGPRQGNGNLRSWTAV